MIYFEEAGYFHDDCSSLPKQDSHTKRYPLYHTSFSPPTCSGDGRFNTILDAEIASTLAVLDYITSSADLGNHNVEIGLVTFSTQATYQGRFQPADPNDSSQVNAALRSTLLGLRSGGYTHFDDALDKSIIYFQGAPPKRSNLVSCGSCCLCCS